MKNKIVCVTGSPFKSPSRHGSVGLALLAALLLCGCSSFNRDWRQAGTQPVAPNSLEGRWEGHWVSDANRHNGNLRCLISRQDEGKYDARFRASYMWLLRFSYTVSLEVKTNGSGWSFEGSADLGKLGGVYTYQGTATQTNFHSDYKSQYDHGIFHMMRVGVE